LYELNNNHIVKSTSVNVTNEHANLCNAVNLFKWCIFPSRWVCNCQLCLTCRLQTLSLDTQKI